MSRFGAIFREFLRAPNKIGAVAGSSSILANKMLDEVDWETAKNIVEYGPGTGAITRHIAARLSAEQRFFAVELNDRFVAVLAKHCPTVKIRIGSVGDIRSICDSEEMPSVDAIISGLPWTAFGEELQNELLDAMFSVLSEQGQFITFAYLHGLPLSSAKRFRSVLEGVFDSVSVSPIVWRNMPPAIFYSCRR
ncbi:MAG: methyltransferase domain-containing protein [Pirellulaceae bacterium]|jgi:phospholipid N-methyltransferase|nr:methyltransferase domain-containing protein [Pirellulaceae bacterium]|tara:strand:+ start:1745 stop:2323 length:579 start_codon:yes stop_codon:yes gene_type:complete